MQRNEETSMALAVAPMQLRVRNRRGLDQVVQLEDRATIGTSTDCSIRLDDADPVHCFIVNGAAGTVLRKWQGEITLNDQPVQDAWLRPGDVVRIGDNEIRVLGEGPQDHEFIATGNQTTDSEAAQSFRLQTRRSAKQRVAALTQSLRQSRSELASFRERSDELADQISILKAETETLHQSITEKDATISELDEQLRGALTHSSTLQREIESLRQQIDLTTNEFQHSNNEWIEQAQRLLQQLEVPADSWPSVQNQGDAPREYLALIASSLQSATGAESQASDHSAQMLTELESRQEEVEQRSQQIDEQVRLIEQQHDELQQIRENLDQSRTELETAQAEFASHKESWEVEQHNLIAQFDSVRAAYEQERTAFDKEKSDSNSQVELEREELRHQVEAATEECNELRKQIETLQAERSEVAVKEYSIDESQANEWTESPVAIDEFGANEFANEASSPANEFDAPIAASSESDLAEPTFAETEVAETEFAEPEFQIEEPPYNAPEFPDQNEPHENEFTSSIDNPDNEFVVEERSDYTLDSGSEYSLDNSPSNFSEPEAYSEPELSQPELLDTEPAEEIEFSSVNNEAPIDTASILAKYGVSAEMDDDEFVTADPAQPGLDQPAAVHSTESDTMDGNTDADSDDNIDEYMAQLLSRVGGASTQPKDDSSQTPSSAEDVVNRSIEALEQQAAPIEEELPPLRPEEFVPRSKAPALDMTSMRSIANETARSAINRHAFKKNRNTLLMQWFMAVCLVIAGVILWMFGTLMTQLGAGLTFVLGVYMGLRAAGIITSTRSMGQKLASIKEKKQKKQRKKKLPKK